MKSLWNKMLICGMTIMSLNACGQAPTAPKAAKQPETPHASAQGARIQLSDSESEKFVESLTVVSDKWRFKGIDLYKRALKEAGRQEVLTSDYSSLLAGYYTSHAHMAGSLASYEDMTVYISDSQKERAAACKLAGVYYFNEVMLQRSIAEADKFQKKARSEGEWRASDELQSVKDEFIPICEGVTRRISSICKKMKVDEAQVRAAFKAELESQEKALKNKTP